VMQQSQWTALVAASTPAKLSAFASIFLKSNKVSLISCIHGRLRPNADFLSLPFAFSSSSMGSLQTLQKSVSSFRRSSSSFRSLASSSLCRRIPFCRLSSSSFCRLSSSFLLSAALCSVSAWRFRRAPVAGPIAAQYGRPPHLHSTEIDITARYKELFRDTLMP
jgi:hypothetical protein